MTKFAVGDTVEYKVVGKVTSVEDDGLIRFTDNNGVNWVQFVKDLTKITPPFPTRIGSHIKAKRFGFNLIEEYVLTKNEFENWYCFNTGVYYYGSDLELISIEYVPNGEAPGE